MERHFRKIVSSFFAILTIFISCSTSGAGVVTPDLQSVLQSSHLSEEIPVIVTLSDQADLSFIKEEKDKHLKRSRIIKELKNKADITQGPLKEFLESRGPKRMVPLWIMNGIAATVPAWMITELADFPGVESVGFDDVIEARPVVLASASPLEWNIGAVKAPDLWDIGFTGTGIVVAHMDTGVDIFHPDLNGKWRGGANDWFNPYSDPVNSGYCATPNQCHPCESNSITPCDTDGHGTMAMGIMVGGDAGGTSIGVAPGAKWIAVKIFNDARAAALSIIHQGFQWLLDPDGNPDTDDAPDIVNNSWGLDNVNGCSSEFQPDIEALRAAGILVVFAAGNSGPSPSTSVSPANNAGVFAVGATDINNTIASFSSRGPSPLGAGCGNGSIFPHVVAPGVNVRTSDITSGGLFPDSYAVVSGTSYSAPHAAGAMALLLSAFPSLPPTDLESILQQTALDLGTPGPDNDYGYGLIDTNNAYRMAFITLHGNISEIASLPSSNEFGNIETKKTSLPQVFTIVNRGTADFLINPSPDGVTLTGTNPSDFVITTDTCSGQAISSLSSCTVAVSFSPTSTGTKSANLSIQSNDPATSVLNVSLNGIGFIAADTIGVYRPSNSTFYLRNSNTTGIADIVAHHGIFGDVPILGDWDGNGTTTIGVYRPSNSKFFLRNFNTTGVADIAFVYGIPGDMPIVGDWTGKGYDSIGVYRPSNSTFYLRNSNTTGIADVKFQYGLVGDIPIVGDWTGKGYDSIGVYRPSNGKFYLRNSNTTGTADTSFSYGVPGDIPFSGDWSGLP